MKIADVCMAAFFVFLGFYMFAAVYPASPIMASLFLVLVSGGGGWGWLVVHMMDVQA